MCPRRKKLLKTETLLNLLGYILTSLIARSAKVHGGYTDLIFILYQYFSKLSIYRQTIFHIDISNGRYPDLIFIFCSLNSLLFLIATENLRLANQQCLELKTFQLSADTRREKYESVLHERYLSLVNRKCDTGKYIL